MPVNELEFQTKIIKAVKAQGGDGWKWATQINKGVPDLILALSPFGLMVMEVKLFREPVPNFMRKLDLTKKQQTKLNDVHNNNGKAMIGLVEDHGARNRKLHIIKHDVVTYGPQLIGKKSVVIEMPYGGHADMRQGLSDFFEQLK